MIVLGIDPGTTRVGYGFLKVVRGTLTFLNCGCLKFEKIVEDDRPYAIYEAIIEILKKQKSDLVAIERVFFSKNKKTAMAVSEARGAIMVAARSQNIPIRSYTPSQVKRAVSTHGRTSKAGVGKMVQLLLGLDEIPRPDDVTDALAVAICCASHDSSNRL